jgi:hypothetical protein
MTLISFILFKRLQPADVASCSSASHAEVQLLYTKTSTDLTYVMENQMITFDCNFQVYKHSKSTITVHICFTGATISSLSIQQR